MYYDPLKYKLQKYSKLGRVPKACCYLKLKPVLSSWLFCLLAQRLSLLPRVMVTAPTLVSCLLTPLL